MMMTKRTFGNAVMQQERVFLENINLNPDFNKVKSHGVDFLRYNNLKLQLLYSVGFRTI